MRSDGWELTCKTFAETIGEGFLFSMELMKLTPSG